MSKIETATDRLKVIAEIDDLVFALGERVDSLHDRARVGDLKAIDELRDLRRKLRDLLGVS